MVNHWIEGGMNEIPATSINAWILVFSGFSFIGLFYSVKLLGTHGKDKMDSILGVYLLLQSIMLLEYVLYWTKLIFSVHAFADISLLFPLLYGPLLLIYFERSFGNDRSVQKHFVHFIPFVVLLAFKLPFYFSSAQFKFYHTHDIMFGAFFDYYYPWLKSGHMALYCVILYSLVSHSAGVGFMRSWARWILAFFSLFVLSSVVHQTLVVRNVLTLQLDYFVSIFPCLSVIFIAWYGKGFRAVADGMAIADSLKIVNHLDARLRGEFIIETAKGSAKEKYKNSGLPKTLQFRLSHDLEKIMYEQQLFKQNDLKLETLAEKLNTNKHFISQVINETYRVNFFEYINLKRIEEAKKLLASRSKVELNVIEVAYEVGFNNKGTFNSVFKRITGLTPTEFRTRSRQLLVPNNN